MKNNVSTQIGVKIIKWVSVFLLSLFMIADRIIISFFVWQDMPGIMEVIKFKHEQERLTKRFGVYGAIALVYLFYKFITWLFA